MLLTVSAWGFPTLASAQASDTILLENIDILGIPAEKYAIGSKVQSIDSIARASLVNGSLQDLLQQETPLYLREYGLGMASTLSLRGMSASHTAVIWNGINLNSVTLGSTDFSNLPMYMFDQVQLHYGGGSSFYGSDALGGSILLKSDQTGAPGLKLQANQTLGSFGQYFGGIQARLGWKDWSFNSRVYYKQAENNFPFKNTAKFGTPSERQENADVQNFGLMQEISYQPASHRRLSLNAWYEESENGVLPLMSNNLRPETYERITDRHLRLSAQYQQQSGWGYTQLTVGYVRDYQQFAEYQPIQSDRTLARGQYDKKLSARLHLKAGADWQYVHARAENYRQAKSQHRADAFAALLYQPLRWWELSLHLRQAWVTGFQAPFVPALGSEISLLDTDSQSLLLKSQVSRNYRVPTFNDLFWEPGGNPELTAEQSWSYESSLDYRHGTFMAEATYFRSNVDDWIIWLDQGSFWSPQNFRKVRVNGIEASSRYQLDVGQIKIHVKAHYAFTASLNQSPVSEFDRSFNKQLPYVPRHRAGLNAQVNYQLWNASLFSQWTSRRFLTTTNESEIAGYALLNLRVNRHLKLGDTDFELSLRINNLLNTDYQNVARRAMPGRYVEMSFQVLLNQ